MAQEDQAQLVARLHTRRTATSESIELLAASTRPVELDQTTQGRLSRMDAIAQQQMALASRSQLLAELKRIDAALERVEKGVFGRCARCQADIDRERLQADPAITFCIDCVEEIQEMRRIQEHRARHS